MTEPTAEPTAELDAPSYLKLAYLLIERAELPAAQEAIEHAKRLAPDHPLPVALEASISLCQGSYKQAMQTLHKALRKWPKAPCLHVYMAEAHWLLGRQRTALTALKKATKADTQGHWRDHIDGLNQLLDVSSSGA